MQASHPEGAGLAVSGPPGATRLGGLLLSGLSAPRLAKEVSSLPASHASTVLTIGLEGRYQVKQRPLLPRGPTSSGLLGPARCVEGSLPTSRSPVLPCSLCAGKFTPHPPCLGGSLVPKGKGREDAEYSALGRTESVRPSLWGRSGGAVHCQPPAVHLSPRACTSPRCS